MMLSIETHTALLGYIRTLSDEINVRELSNLHLYYASKYTAATRRLSLSGKHTWIPLAEENTPIVYSRYHRHTQQRSNLRNKDLFLQDIALADQNQKAVCYCTLQYIG